MRQTVRTNNAAVVAAGALKPTSVYTVTRIENALVVIAHLSEGIPRHWLIDNASLEAFLANELEYGLRTAVEAKVLADVNAHVGHSDAGVRDQCAGDAAEGHHEARGGRLHAVGVRAAPDRLGGRRARAVSDECDRTPGAALRSGDPPAVRRAGHDVATRRRPASVTYWQATQSLWTPTRVASTCSGRRMRPRTRSARTSCSPGARAVTRQAFSARSVWCRST